MCTRKLWILAIALAAVALAVAQAPPLLPAPIEPRVQTVCTECHDSGIILQQRLDAAAWGKEVEKMTRWGATVAPVERAAFVKYLSENFGPDKPPAIPPYAKARTPHQP